jgi:hypothetical protein
MKIASGKLVDLERDILAEGPRWRLLKHGEDTFVKALKPFPGQRVTVVICRQDDGERSQLEQLLLNFFPKAGWNPTLKQWDECPMWMGGGNDIYFVTAPSGLPNRWIGSYVCRRESARVGVEGAAKALCDVLNKLNIGTSATNIENLPENAMRARQFVGMGTPGSPGGLVL